MFYLSKESEQERRSRIKKGNQKYKRPSSLPQVNLSELSSLCFLLFCHFLSPLIEKYEQNFVLFLIINCTSRYIKISLLQKLFFLNKIK